MNYSKYENLMQEYASPRFNGKIFGTAKFNHDKSKAANVFSVDPGNQPMMSEMMTPYAYTTPEVTPKNEGQNSAAVGANMVPMHPALMASMPFGPGRHPFNPAFFGPVPMPFDPMQQ